jgi:hypothetical protein
MEVSRFPAFLSSVFSTLVSFLDARIRERTLRLFLGMLLAQDKRRTASKWFRAAGIGDEYKLAYKHIASVGRESQSMATEVLRTIKKHPASNGDKAVIALDDTLTKRRGPCVEGAGLHHNPTPGPAGQRLEYGQNFVAAAYVARHPEHGTIGLPVRAKMYVRKKDVGKLPEHYGWKFKTKLELAVEILLWLSIWLVSANKAIWIVADGAYAKKPILDACLKYGYTLISRLRKDAALYEVPAKSKTKGRGRPRKYGKKRIELAKRAAHAQGWTTETITLYGKPVVKKYKTFLATWKPAGGVIRVVLVKEEGEWIAFFSTNLEATPAEILGAVADRNAIEQVFKDVKEVWGAGQQQLRNIYANVGAFHMNLWMMTLTELWAWDQPEEVLVDRSDRPWDNKPRRPSHNDRRKSLLRHVLGEEFRRLPQKGPGARLIKKVCRFLMGLAA